jgi:hypothetical protein
MAQPGLGTFDLGMLNEGTDVEVVLMTPAKIRLVPSNTVTALTSKSGELRKAPCRQPLRRFRVPYSGRWRILVEHADENKKGGCAIRLSTPLTSPAPVGPA